MKWFIALLLFAIVLVVPALAQNPLLEIIQQHQEEFGPVFKNPDHFEVQIIYTQIDRNKENVPHFQSFHYRLDTTNYFYPASTVKMPVAFLSLEKINQLGIKGLDKHTPVRNGIGSPPQTAAFVDVTAENLLPSVAHYIKKIFLVSDNDAYNRLYEFLGQRAINQSLFDKGFRHTRIIHRLSAPDFDAQTNRSTNPVSFYQNDQLLYHQGEVHSVWEEKLSLAGEVKGAGFIDKKGNLVQQPFDFRAKNYVSLLDLHQMLRAVLFPMSVPAEQRFDLKEEDYQFLYQSMSQLPDQSDYPKYDKPDGYVKFFMYGGHAEEIPEHIRIFNKVGDAYGYLTDVAYVVDLKNKIEFMIAATIHVNENRIYNDGQYEYEQTGFPFFETLGNLIYQYELSRERPSVPDFSRFLR